MTETNCKDAIIEDYMRSVNDDKRMIDYNTLILLPMYKELKLKEFTKNADIQRAKNEIDRKYMSGFKLSKSYPGIPKSALDNITQPLINIGTVSTTKVVIANNNDENFFNNHIVGVDRKLYTCPQVGGWTDCYFSPSLVDRMCCECGKPRLCNPGTGCYASLGVFEQNGVQRTCDIELSNNLFEFSINKEKADAEKAINDNIIRLRTNYNNALSNRPKPTPAKNIDCCQEINFGVIEANNVIITSSSKCIIK